MLFALLL